MLIFIGLGFGHRRVHFLRVLKGLVFDGGWLFWCRSSACHLADPLAIAVPIKSSKWNGNFLQCGGLWICALVRVMRTLPMPLWFLC